MNIWILDTLCVVLLVAGSRFFSAKFLRRICFVAVVYLVIFLVCYYLWLHVQYADFKAHPGVEQVGIKSAFQFEGFWKLLGNMFLLDGILPVALLFVLIFGVKWLTTYTGPGSTYY